MEIARFGDGIPSVSGTAERGVLIPSPVKGQKVYRQDTGSVEEYSGSAWVAVFTSSDPRSLGADSTGATDARSYFVTVDALSECYLSPGTYLISSNLTLSGHWRFAKGAKLKPASGVTITIAGPITAGLYQIFDSSAGGTIVFGAGSTEALYVEWWGALAGTSDSTTAVQAALDAANASSCKEVRLSGKYSVSGVTFNGNGITLSGVGSGYGYESSLSNATAGLTARTGTVRIVDMAPLNHPTNDPRNCIVKGLHLNGNSVASVMGLRVSGANIIENVLVSGCSTAFNLTNYTNSVHLVRCAAISNVTGLYVDGSSATTFSVTSSNFSLNTSAGIWLDGGVSAKFRNVVVESNTTYGVLIRRPSGYTTMGQFFFTGCWIEDNGTGITIDTVNSGDRSEANAPFMMRFTECHINASSNTRAWANLACVKDIEFVKCVFRGTTLATALATSATAFRVGLRDCTFDSTTAPTTQIPSFVANGIRCYVADTSTRFAVTFAGTWVNQGAGFPEAKYWQDDMGNTRLQGNIKSGTIGTVAFTLPVGYRPATTRRFAVVSNGAFGELEVQTDGDVIPISGNTASVNLDGVCFPTD